MTGICMNIPHQVDATDKSVCNTVVLFWLLIPQDNLRCFGRHSQRKKATLKSSCVALKSWNTLHFIDPKLISLQSFEFHVAIWVNIRLLYGRKAETLRIYHGHSMGKTSMSKRSFSPWYADGACNRAFHGCSLCPSTTFAPKKRCGLWLTFFATRLRGPSRHEPY